MLFTPAQIEPKPFESDAGSVAPTSHSYGSTGSPPDHYHMTLADWRNVRSTFVESRFK